MTPQQRQKIDEHVRAMWILYADIFDKNKNPEEFTDDDLDVWMAVTKHQAVQGRLKS